MEKLKWKEVSIMNANGERRAFLKRLLSLIGFGTTFLSSFKKDEGFKIGKMKINSLGTSEAFGKCGASFDCAGGGGQCGASYDCPGGGGKCGASFDCAGGRGDPAPRRSTPDDLSPTPRGGGKCGASFDCTGGGGKCGASFDCAGGGGKCGASFDCSGS
jgi:hypothetical protein